MKSDNENKKSLNPNSLPISLQQAPDSVTQKDFDTAVLLPPFKRGYSIYFGTLDFFVFIKRIVMIYERFAIAKKHIADKLAEDLATQKIID